MSRYVLSKEDVLCLVKVTYCSMISNEPCRQTRTLRALVAAAFAVYIQKAIYHGVNGFPP